MRTYLTNEQTNSEENERLESLEKENHMLNAKNKSLSERADFMEECIAEMAMQLYS
ncbi:hypothetical protein [Exiguobacterium sp. S22-S28]|uniref:hypothetical protein n=1 Tax=Exiguobacterium sp. S22-S28 TaxID=3342768 RepID=UPI00372D25F2